MRGRWTVLVAAVCVSLMSGVARADFTLTGSQHLDVSDHHGFGKLYDSSTATILPGGVVGFAYLYGTSGMI